MLVINHSRSLNRLTIEGKLSKWGHQSKHQVPRVLGSENILQWLDTVVDWLSLPEACKFTTILKSWLLYLTDACYYSYFQWLLLIWNGNDFDGDCDVYFW